MERSLAPDTPRELALSIYNSGVDLGELALTYSLAEDERTWELWMKRGDELTPVEIQFEVHKGAFWLHSRKTLELLAKAGIDYPYCNYTDIILRLHQEVEKGDGCVAVERFMKRLQDLQGFSVRVRRDPPLDVTLFGYTDILHYELRTMNVGPDVSNTHRSYRWGKTNTVQVLEREDSIIMPYCTSRDPELLLKKLHELSQFDCSVFEGIKLTREQFLKSGAENPILRKHFSNPDSGPYIHQNTNDTSLPFTQRDLDCCISGDADLLEENRDSVTCWLAGK